MRPSGSGAFVLRCAVLAADLALALVTLLLYRPVLAEDVGPAAKQLILSTLPQGIFSPAVRVDLVSPSQGWGGGAGNRCSSWTYEWRDTALSTPPTLWASVNLTRCPSIQAARELQHSGRPLSADLLPEPTSIPGAVRQRGQPFAGWTPGEIQEIDFRCGGYYAQVAVYGAVTRSVDVGRAVTQLALAQRRPLPGAPGGGSRSLTQLTLQPLPGGTLYTFGLILAARSLVGWARYRLRGLSHHLLASPTSSAVGGPRMVDVQPRAQQAARAARVSHLLVVCGLVTVGLALRSRGLRLPICAVGCICLAASLWPAGRARHLSRGPHARRQERPRAEVAWCVSAVTAAATAFVCFCAAVVWAHLYGAHVVMPNGRVDPSIATDEVIARWAAGLPVWVLVADLLMLSVSLASLYVFTLLRARTSSGLMLLAPEASGRKGMTLRRSGLHGRALAYRWRPLGFDDFRALAQGMARRAGPVRWQADRDTIPVPNHAATTILVNAAPDVDVRPSAVPELQALSEAGLLPQAVLVFPPATGAHFHARWDAFRARNSAYLGSLREIGRRADWVLVARRESGEQWIAWCAGQKIDWTYAVALEEATRKDRAGDPDPQTFAVPPLVVGACEQPPVLGTRPSGGEHKTRRPRRAVVLAGVLPALITAVATATSTLMTPPARVAVAPVLQHFLLPANALTGGFVVVSADGLTPALPPPRHGVSCGEQDRVWQQASTKRRVEVQLVACSPQGALTALEVPVRAPLPGSPDAANESPAGGASPGNERASRAGATYYIQTTVFRHGPVAAFVSILSPIPLTPADLALHQDVLRRQGSLIPGRQQTGRGLPNTAILTRRIGRLSLDLIVLALVGVAVAALIRRYRGPHPPTGQAPLLTTEFDIVDVRRTARRRAFAARTRFFLHLVGGYCLLLGVIGIHGRSRLVALSVSAACYGSAALIRRTTPQWRARMRRGALTGRRTLRALAMLVVSGGAALLCVLLLAVGLTVATLIGTGATYSHGLLVAPGLVARNPVATALFRIPLPLLSADILALAFVAALASVFCNRLARRIAALTADEALPDVANSNLLLRNFDDDKTRVLTSRLSRNSLMAKVFAHGLENFEDILVRQLDAFRPLFAVSQPHSGQHGLGTIRVDLPPEGDAWKNRVREWIRDCPMIVVIASPYAYTEGLLWELETIAAEGALSRALLVMLPLPARTKSVRWAVFRSMAHGLAMPPGLDEWAERALLVAQDEQGTWTVWCSDKPTEWDYAVALQDASARIRSRSSTVPPRQPPPPGRVLRRWGRR